MGVKTEIQWCDSSLNLQMGCAGCELWNPQTGNAHCYAGNLTRRWEGRKGWPARFELPQAFPERVNKLTGWSDLSGTKRPDKPWLDGLPRLVFLNDMGDTFTEGMDDDWFAEFLEPLAELPHIFIVLTKRARKGADFFLRHGLPRNFWFCVSVTGQSTIPRARELLRLREAFGPDAVLGLSVEPLLDDLCLAARAPEVIPALSWVKIGGESSQAEAQARPTLLGWVRRLRDDIGAQAAVFIKQLGTHPFDTLPGQVAGREMRLKDGHGGDWSEWPSDLRVREMPAPAAC